MAVNHLFVDLETFSSENLKKAGMYRYTLSPDFDILLFGVSAMGGSPAVYDLTTNKDRNNFFKYVAPYLCTDQFIFHAFNAAFEWYCLSVYLSRHGVINGLLPIQNWRDTQLHAMYCGYPAGLEKAGQAIGLPNDSKKSASGKALIKLFSCPRKPTARDPRTRILPQDEPEKWELYKKYNAQDVVAEMAVEDALAPWPVPDFVQKQWELDLMQAAQGICVDRELVNGALRIIDQNTQQLLAEASQLTGLDNPNSAAQLREWLLEELGDGEVPNMQKATITNLLKDCPDGEAKRAMQIRLELGKAAHKKYAAIDNMICPDGRMRGVIQFYGGSRTGRWAGRGLQVQNLSKTDLPALDYAREIVKGACGV